MKLFDEEPENKEENAILIGVGSVGKKHALILSKLVLRLLRLPLFYFLLRALVRNHPAKHIHKFSFQTFQFSPLIKKIL